MASCARNARISLLPWPSWRRPAGLRPTVDICRGISSGSNDPPSIGWMTQKFKDPPRGRSPRSSSTATGQSVLGILANDIQSQSSQKADALGAALDMFDPARPAFKPAEMIPPYHLHIIAPIYPAINSAILTSLPLRQHGPMAGLIVIFSALGGTTGSIITGYVFQAYGGQTAFYFSLVPIVLLLILITMFSRMQKRVVA